MLYRIPTSMQSSAMLSSMTQAQRNLMDANEQVTSGRRINNFSDSPSDIGQLMAVRAADARAADFHESAKLLKSRLDLQNTQLEELASTIGDFKKATLDALSGNSGAKVAEQMGAAFARVSTVLRSQLDGKYTYGGTRQDVSPLTVNSLNDLVALPTTDAAFQNSANAQSAMVDVSQTIQFGQLASNLGKPIFDILRQFANFNSGPSGPFAEPLTAAQATFLSSMTASFDSAYQKANAILGDNGINTKAVEDAMSRHSAARDVYAQVMSDIETVDMPTAISKLQAAELAMQASAKVFSSVGKMTLLDYLPV